MYEHLITVLDDIAWQLRLDVIVNYNIYSNYYQKIFHVDNDSIISSFHINNTVSINKRKFLQQFIVISSL